MNACSTLGLDVGDTVFCQLREAHVSSSANQQAIPLASSNSLQLDDYLGIQCREAGLGIEKLVHVRRGVGHSVKVKSLAGIEDNQDRTPWLTITIRQRLRCLQDGYS